MPCSASQVTKGLPGNPAPGSDLAEFVRCPCDSHDLLTSAHGQGFWDIDSDTRVLDELLAANQLVDCGDVDILPTLPEATWDNVTDAVRTILSRGAMPLVLGGDHAVTFPVVRAYDEPITLVQFDAHMDYQDFSTGITLGHANPMRAIDDLPHVEKIVHAGIRSFRTNEDEVLQSRAPGKHGPVGAGHAKVGHRFELKAIPAASKVYLTLDIDVLDAPWSPGSMLPNPTATSLASCARWSSRSPNGTRSSASTSWRSIPCSTPPIS